MRLIIPDDCASELEIGQPEGSLAELDQVPPVTSPAVNKGGTQWQLSGLYW
jgi:hypothetical protein